MMGYSKQPYCTCAREFKKRGLDFRKELEQVEVLAMQDLVLCHYHSLADKDCNFRL